LSCAKFFGLCPFLSFINLQIGYRTDLLLEKFQISCALVFDIFGVVAFIVPSRLNVPLFYIIIVVIVVIVESEVSFLGGFLSFCILSACLLSIEEVAWLTLERRW